MRVSDKRNQKSQLGAAAHRCVAGLRAVLILIAGVMFHSSSVSLAGSLSNTEVKHDGKAELNKLQEVYRKFLALQKLQASDAEWEQFKKQVQDEMKPVVKYLSETAYSEYPHLQHMLWASRDWLPKMLDSARTTPSQDQVKFIKNLKRAEQLINKGS